VHVFKQSYASNFLTLMSFCGDVPTDDQLKTIRDKIANEDQSINGVAGCGKSTTIKRVFEK